MEEKKSKAKFSDKHPVIGLLLVTFGSYLIAQYVLGLAFMYPLNMIAGMDINTGMPIGVIIGSLIVLVIWHRKCSPAYRYMPGKGDFSGSFKFLSAIILYWIVLFGSYAVMAGGFPFGRINFTDFVSALMAGLSEEIIFREISMSYMTKHWRSEKMIPVMALLSGFLFGLAHMTNMVGGSTFMDALYQMLLCIFMGTFLGAVYLRKGSVWALIIVHTLHDILSFSGGHALRAAGVGDFPTWAVVLIYGSEFLLGVFGLFLLRKSRREEIIKFWDRKWSRQEQY